MEPNQDIQNMDAMSGNVASVDASGNSSSGKDIVFNDSSKSGKGMAIGMAFLAILAAGGIGFGVWAMLDGNQKVEKLNSEISSLKQQNSELQESISSNSSSKSNDSDSDNNVSGDSKRSCEGTYYGEASGTSSNGLSYDLKYTYTLNGDGIFSANFSDTSGTEGVYTINDNTISLTGMRETVGPRDEVPYYSTKDYVIADDCSSIKVNDGEAELILNKQ